MSGDGDRVSQSGRVTVRNEVSGAIAGSVVQAGVVVGDVHFHAASRMFVAPKQLPAIPRSFVGRDVELAELTASLGTEPGAVDRPRLAAIVGPGGMGKTWLGLRGASQELARFPDGQLFLDLQGFSPSKEPLSTEVALRVLLHGLGVDQAALPADVEARVGLYRSVVANRHMLIMLDNALDTAQVTPLLPGTATCAVLVTSRNRLVGLTSHGARIIRLRELSGGEAGELLAVGLGRARTSAESSAVARLVAFCAGLPLALSVVIARAAGQPSFPLGVLAAELDDHGGRLDTLDAGDLPLNVRAAFDCSYQALSPGAATMFGLLGLAPGPDVSVAAVANLVSTPIHDARSLLVELENAHLVEQHVPGRYGMHDLLRLYAREQASATQNRAVRERAIRRMMEFYARTASATDALLDSRSNALVLPPLGLPAVGQEIPILATRDDAWTWFETERAVVCAVQAMALEMECFELVFHLAWAMDTFLARRGYRHDRLNMWNLGLVAAQRANVETMLCHAHLMVGDVSSYFDCLARGSSTSSTRSLCQSTPRTDLPRRLFTSRWQPCGPGWATTGPQCITRPRRCASTSRCRTWCGKRRPLVALVGTWHESGNSTSPATTVQLR